MKRANCGWHPLIHTLLKFNLAQDIWFYQRLSSLGNSLPQTGHSFSVGSIIRLTLHIENLTEWSLARSISAGSRLVIRLLRIRKVTLWVSETGSQWVSLVAIPAKEVFITVRPWNMYVTAWTLFKGLWRERGFTLCLCHSYRPSTHFLFPLSSWCRVLLKNQYWTNLYN